MRRRGISFNEGEREALLERGETFLLPRTRFNFINDHASFRPGNRHVLMGTSGTGKSTLARSLILDVASEIPVILLSSEEDLQETKHMFALRKVTDENAANIELIHDKDLLRACRNDSCDLETWRRCVGARILGSGAKALVFDNITTSIFYDGVPYANQVRFLSCLDSLATHFHIPVIVVAHTKKNVKDDQPTMIAADDVRGPMTLTNSAQFLYVYHKFTQKTAGVSQPIKCFVRVVKARGVGNVNRVYALNFNHEQRSYESDREVTYSDFVKAYSERVKLSGK